MMQINKNAKPVALADILKKYQPKVKNKHIKYEYQDYGYLLAEELGEPKRVSLYIKLAKIENRGLLERARYYVRDAPNVRSRGKLFIWAFTRLKQGKKLGKEKRVGTRD